LVNQKDYVEAARVFRQLNKLREHAAHDGLLRSETAQDYVCGYTDETISYLLNRLLATGRPFEAYRLVLDQYPPGAIQSIMDHGPSDSGYCLAARAAALAGTGQGLDVPLPAGRPAIRKHALEWLSADFDTWKKNAAALPVLGTNAVGLPGSQSGQSPLLVISVLAARSPAAAAEDRGMIHEGMNGWLTSPDLARVREDRWLAELPAEEREQWRRFWGEVRSLRDRTAPRINAPPLGR
jgi:hypothetical protein